MEVKEVFNCESLIDFNEIIKILDSNCDKKIICFGAGTAASILQRKIFNNYSIECYLDNNENNWGKTIGTIPICNPERILEYPKGSFLILIISKATLKISEQLKSYNLREKIDFVNIYDKFIPYFRMQKFADSADQFEKFINRTPDNYFKDVPLSANQGKIGVCCIASIADWCTWYPIVLYMILKKRGYNVELIVDCLEGFYDITLYDKHTEIVQKYIDYILQLLKDYIPDMNVKYVSAAEPVSLQECDYKEVDRLTELNVVWHEAQLDQLYGISNEKRYILFRSLLIKDMKVIKGFFYDNKYEVICLTTGLHRTWGLYTYLGHKSNIRVSTYDGYTYGDDWTFFSTDYCCLHSYDVRKVIEKNMLSECRQNILEYAQKVFESRIHSDNSIDRTAWQTVENNTLQKDYDIIMPLNLPWDGPALGLNRCFETFGDWVMETVRYVYENTNATLLIREHPCTRVNQDYYNASWKKQVMELVGDSDRIYYCSWDEDLNIYRCFEKAKIVIPYSSTSGIEAAVLGCEVITHTDCYYDTLEFVNRANNKMEYFQLIEEGLNGNLQSSEANRETALLAFAYVMNDGIETGFREQITEWIEWDIDKVQNMKGVDEIVNVVAENIPATYQNILRTIGNGQ